MESAFLSRWRCEAMRCDVGRSADGRDKKSEIEAMDRPSLPRSLFFSLLIFVWHRAIAIHYVDRPRAEEKRNAITLAC